MDSIVLTTPVKQKSSSTSTAKALNVIDVDAIPAIRRSGRAYSGEKRYAKPFYKAWVDADVDNSPSKFGMEGRTVRRNIGGVEVYRKEMVFTPVKVTKSAEIIVQQKAPNRNTKSGRRLINAMKKSLKKDLKMSISKAIIKGKKGRVPGSKEMMMNGQRFRFEGVLI